MPYSLAAIGVALALIIGGAVFFFTSQSDNSEVISMRGLHWHPSLEIYVKGVQQEIPEGIGLGAVHMPMHTHDDLPLIHLEFNGVVRSEDLMLGEFFKNWGRDMRSFGANMRMMVNGVENVEYENYLMHDGDKIQLFYD